MSQRSQASHGQERWQRITDQRTKQIIKRVKTHGLTYGMQFSNADIPFGHEAFQFLANGDRGGNVDNFEWQRHGEEVINLTESEYLSRTCQASSDAVGDTRVSIMLQLFNKVVDHGDRYKKFTEEDVIASEDIIKEVALYQTTYAASNSELVADRLCIAKSIREEEDADMEAVEDMINVIPTYGKHCLFARRRHLQSRIAMSSHFHYSRRQGPTHLNCRIRSGIWKFYGVPSASD